MRTDVPPRWVKPALVVEVEYRQRTSDGLRHAALKSVRPEKKARGMGAIGRSGRIADNTTDHGTRPPAHKPAGGNGIGSTAPANDEGGGETWTRS